MQELTQILHNLYYRMVFACAVLAFILIGNAQAQTTAFTYQGRLTDAGSPADGMYDFRFRLFDSSDFITGIQQGPTINLTSVQVENGIFTVELDFGAGVFTGAARFLEIGLRPSGSPNAFNVLSPRQPLTSTPYAVRSATASSADTAANATNATNATNAANAMNAAQLGGIAASQYVVTTDARLTDARPPTANSPNYVQNTTSQQASTNFNISGDGTAGGTLSGGVINAASQFKLGGSRILSAPGTNNLFAGVGAGAVNTGANNAFFGRNSGLANTSGEENAFFGASAGSSNTTGSRNSFFGFEAGRDITTGGGNSFFGWWAGRNNSTGGGNSFFGSNSGRANTTGSENSFFGNSAGSSNTTGILNSFFGSGAGGSNTTGDQNAFFGETTGTINSTGSFNSFFGQAAGNNNSSGSSNSFFGEGAGSGNTIGGGNTFVGRSAGFRNTTGSSNTFIGNGANFDITNPTGVNNTLLGALAQVSSGVSFSTAIGEGARVTQSSSLVLGRFDVKVGIGTTAPSANLHIAANSGNILLGDAGCGPGDVAIGFRLPFSGCANYALLGGDGNTYINRPAGGAIVFREANGSNQVEIRSGGTVGIAVLGTAGSTQLCRNGVLAIATCSSSLRYKRDIEPFARGLELIERLRPIRFTWKQDGMRDVGFGAEEVAEVEPLLVTHNDKGQVEGVKYDRITVALVNAIREQQAQIAKQQEEIKRQQAEIILLKNIVCLDHPDAEACRVSK